jgi:hypothetical protein
MLVGLPIPFQHRFHLSEVISSLFLLPLHLYLCAPNSFLSCGCITVRFPLGLTKWLIAWQAKEILFPVFCFRIVFTDTSCDPNSLLLPYLLHTLLASYFMDIIALRCHLMGAAVVETEVGEEMQ